MKTCQTCDYWIRLSRGYSCHQGITFWGAPLSMPETFGCTWHKPKAGRVPQRLYTPEEFEFAATSAFPPGGPDFAAMLRQAAEQARAIERHQEEIEAAVQLAKDAQDVGGVEP